MDEPFFRFLTGVLLAGAIGLAAGRLRFLAPSGAWAAFALGSIVFGIGGAGFSIPLIVFFVLSSLLSKYGPKRWDEVRQRLGETFEKGSTRDAGQVLANGGIAGVAVIIYAIHPADAIFAAYLGSLAAAAADTWGTELGTLSRGGTVSILTLRRVAPGVSGGISAAGTAGAVAGACCVTLSGAFRGDLSAAMFAAPLIGGIAGMFADSIAGASLQARYRCVVCDTLTERSVHCGEPARLAAGRRWATNDLVNIICCLVGGVLSYLLFSIFS